MSKSNSGRDRSGRKSRRKSSSSSSSSSRTSQDVTNIFATPDADPGDETARNFRYQYAYGVVLLVAAKSGERPYLALWCEHHEDFLAEGADGCVDGYQIKTRRPELGAWTLTDRETIKAIGRFVDLVTSFGDRINALYFVSNADFHSLIPEDSNEKRRGRCPGLFLKHLRG